MGSNGDLHGDLPEDFETKWDLVGTSLSIQRYKYFKKTNKNFKAFKNDFRVEMLHKYFKE